MTFIESKAELRFLDFILIKEFSTPSSTAFSVRKMELGSARGWLDLHYPCEGHIKVRIRVAFLLSPKEVHCFIVELLEQLGVSKLETFEALVFEGKGGFRTDQRIDRNGITDCIQTTRKFALPPD